VIKEMFKEKSNATSSSNYGWMELLSIPIIEHTNNTVSLQQLTHNIAQSPPQTANGIAAISIEFV
jgi:hypothetical protein